MRRRTMTAAASLMIVSVAAQALQTPRPARPGGDPHVQVIEYNPAEPTKVVGAVGRPLTISFAPYEHITRVALETASIIDGKTVSPPWEGPDASQMQDKPIGNILPLWAMHAGRSTAQIMTTSDDNKTTRVYALLLIALPRQPDVCQQDDCDDPRMTTGLTFLYPGDRKQAGEQRAVQVRQTTQKLAAEERLKTDCFYGQRNWKYVAKGDPDMIKRLAPDQTSDNTQCTGFLYRGNRPVPAFYIASGPDGKIERQVTPIPDKDLLAAPEAIPACFMRADHTLPPDCTRWRLRSGTDVADIYNVGPESVGDNPYTGTTSPNVIRVVRRTPVTP